MTWPYADERPRATSAQIRAFIETFESRGFRHADELIPILKRADPAESAISVREYELVDGFRLTYRIRAQTAGLNGPSATHPIGLSDDLQALSESLDRASDQPMRSWATHLRSGIVYIVFELVDDQVACCVKSADQRIVTQPLR